VLSVEPVSLAFGARRAGTTSPAQQVVVTNTGSDVLHLSAALAGADFALGAALPATLAAGASALLPVTFGNAGTVAGNKTGTLTLSSTDAGIASQQVSLAGTATFPNPTLSTSALAFGGRIRGSKTSLPVTLTNPQLNPATVDALTVAGFTLTGTDAADCVVTPPANGVIQPDGAGAAWAVAFTPSRSTGDGAESATLTLKTDAGDQVVSLTGTSLFPVPTLTPPALAFGLQPKGTTSAAQTLTVGNDGTASFTIKGWYLTGADFCDFDVSPASASRPVQPAATVTYSVTFTPSKAAAESGTLVLDTDAGPLSVALSGTGVDASLAFSKTSIDFGPQRVLSPSALVGITATNATSHSIQINSVVLSGPQGSEFSAQPSAQLPIVLAPGDAASLEVGFDPAAAGARAATLALSSDDPSTLGSTVSLSGTGIAPSVDLSPLAVDFGQVRVGTAADQRAVVLKNGGTDALSLQQATLTGAGAAAFSLQGVPQLPAVLQPGEQLSLGVGYTPGAVGSDVASLALTTDAPLGGSAAVALQGKGVSPAFAATPSALLFGAVRLGVAAAPLAVLLTNSGGAQGKLQAFAFSGPDAADFSLAGAPELPSPIGADGGATSVLIAFTPSAHGDRLATLTLTTDAGDAQIALSGTGLSAALSASPTTLDFGSMAVGAQPKALPVTVTNGGDAPLRLGLPRLDGANAAAYVAEAAAEAASIDPGKSATVTVLLAAGTAGAAEATLTLSGQDGDAAPAQIKLHGTVVTPSLTATTALDFKNTNVGKASTAQQATVTNSGQVDVTVTALAIDQAGFLAQADGLPRTLKPGDSLQAQISFVPFQTGAAHATLSVFVQGQGAALAQVALSGTGVGKSGCGSAPADPHVLVAAALVLAALRRRRR
jgi:uncharacterized protein (TIGR03382 family)